MITSLNDIGLNIKDYELHSVRAVAATATANLGINDRLFKKRGRWNSENVKEYQSCSLKFRHVKN